MLFDEFDKAGYNKEKEMIQQTKDIEKIEAALDEILDAETKRQVLEHLK